MKTLALTALLATTALAAPKLTQKKIAYELDGAKYESVLVYDAKGAVKPALVLVPNWLGITEANLKQAELVASRGYTVFVADVYGATTRPANMDEAGKMSTALKNDRATLRKRVNKALEVFLAQKDAKADFKKVGAIGFCFGGTAALELARSGAAITGVAVFHAGLATPTPADAKNFKGHVLALQGADDPYVPAEERAAFEKEMRDAKLDWELVAFGNTVHSFTDVDAHMAGQADYNEASAKRAYALMDSFFAEVFR